MPTYTGGRTRRTIQDVVYTTRSRLKFAKTEEARARISALLAKHEVELAEADRPPADGLRECTRCKARLEPTKENFPPKGDYANKLHPECRACGRARAAEGYARKVLGEAANPPRAKPGPKPDGLTAEEKAREGRASEIRLLIRRYEAVRDIPGPDRSAAYNTLGLALKRHGWPVSDGVREWSWASGMGEITTRRISWTWKPPADPHADPKRLAKTR